MIRSTITILGTTLLLAAPLRAGEDLRELEDQQTQARQRTLDVAERLAAVLAELDESGAGGETSARLATVRATLGEVAEQEMRAALASLAEARSALARDDAASREHLSDALARQDAALARLRSILIEYRRQVLAEEVRRSLEELSVRQTELAADVARKADRAGAAERVEPKTLRAESDEQQRVAAAVARLVEQMESMRSDAPDDPFDAALAVLNNDRLARSLADASDLLGGGAVRSAVEPATTAAELLQQAAAVLVPESSDDDRAARHAGETIDRIIAEQQALRAASATASPDARAALRDAQAELANRLDAVTRLQTPPAEARQHLESAGREMRRAAEAVAGEPEQAARHQQAALDALERARDVVERQAERRAEQSRQQMVTVEALLEETRREQARAESIAGQADAGIDTAGALDALGDDLASLAARARRPVPEAADSIRRAADASADPDLSAADRARQSAAHLRQASEQLQRSLEATRQLLEEKQELEQARERLVDALEAQHDAQQASLDAKALDDAADTPAARKEQANRDAVTQQKQANDATKAALDSLPSSARAAEGEVRRADWQREQAVRDLEQGKLDEARQHQRTSGESVRDGIAKLDERLAEVARQLGESDDAVAEAAAADRAIDAAAQATADAQAKLDAQNSSKAVAGDLAKASGDLAGSLPDARQASSQLPGLVQSASERLAEAAARSRAGDDNAARRALDEAEAALAAADAEAARALREARAERADRAPSVATEASDTPPRPGERDAADAEAAQALTTQGRGEFLGLPDRERAALEQSQRASYPPEYAELIEAYLRALAETERQEPTR